MTLVRSLCSEQKYVVELQNYKKFSRLSNLSVQLLDDTPS
jgi:spore coat protein CotF